MAASRLSAIRLPWDTSVKLPDRFNHILSLFPQDFVFAFAYGSGAFKQHGQKSIEDNVVDLIFVVEDAETFHQSNLKHNSKHYSSMKYLGPKTLASFQDQLGARVYFNTLVPYRYGLLKYGVISSSALITDLLDWEWLYISGRLHKPILPLVQPVPNHPLRSALQHNLQNAMHTALLFLPDVFYEETFYQTIAGLSYTGDFRMSFGEDRNKVKNIVRPQVDRFRELYSSFWPALSAYAEFNPSTGRCEQDTSPLARMYHLNLLPKKIQQTIVHEWNRDGRWQDVEDVFRAAAHDTECPELVKEAVQKTVNASSWTQSLKGIPTAGFVKSVRYGMAKIVKFWKSLKKSSSDS
uniref:Phosphatidate cytidylyltransferase, mitochondrial n=1 Tax=Scapholeberis mucronata TaxID=202097 RepID=A0A4Y7NK88_9CRUS|nr:EOG090X06VP [Scapholeberis mucronata]SVE93641.1 EOG090X06VP [Scapholeberis mucronata]